MGGPSLSLCTYVLGRLACVRAHMHACGNKFVVTNISKIYQKYNMTPRMSCGRLLFSNKFVVTNISTNII